MAKRGLWRKRQIILSPEVVQELFAWHGGQFMPTYSLASTGMENLVSVSMIDAAVSELESSRRKVKSKKDKRELGNLIGELHAVSTFWREHSAKEAGMDMREDEYEYDLADYGLDAEAEAQLDRETEKHG